MKCKKKWNSPKYGRKKENKKWNSLGDLWDSKENNIHIRRVPDGEAREKGVEHLLEK